jgi:lipid A 3-O-deacylase
VKIFKLSLFILFGIFCADIAHCESLRSEALINEVRVGIMAHDVATRSTKHEDGSDFNGEFYFRSPAVKLLRLLGSPRPSIGFSVNNNNGTSQLYSAINWGMEFTDRLFVNVGLGGTVHNGALQSTDPDRQRLGSRTLFRFAIAAGFNINKKMNVSAMFDHASNGRLAYPNNALEKFGVQFGFTY